MLFETVIGKAVDDERGGDIEVALPVHVDADTLFDRDGAALARCPTAAVAQALERLINGAPQDPASATLDADTPPSTGAAGPS